MGWTVRFCLFSTVITVACALNSYIILVPKVIRPGVTENISINVLSNLADHATARIEASLLAEQGNTVFSSEDVFRKDEPRALQLQIPSDIDSSLKYQIRVQGHSGLVFVNTTDVEIESKALSLLIQTDKGVYKAGQNVRIRSFGLHPDGSVFIGNITLEIMDPKGNMIKQWRDLQEPMYGVVNKTFMMDDKPVLGMWKVKATVMETSSTSTFEVSEYVLPKFKTELTLPSYVMVTDNDISGKFLAKYTYGKAATGQLNLRVNIKGLSPNFMTWSGDMYQQTLHISDEKKFSIPFQHLQDHIRLGADTVADHINGLYLHVNATFTEDLTGKSMSEVATIQFKNETVQVNLLNTGSTRYLPGFDFHMKVQFTDNDGRPPTKHIGKFDLTIVATDNAMKESVIESRSVNVPPSGVADVSFRLPEESTNTEKVQIKVVYGTIIKTLNLLPYSANETHVKLRIMSDNHKAGSKISVEASSNKDFKTLTYQLISRGVLLETNKISFPLANDTHMFEFPVTSVMSPEVTVLVYGMDDQGKIYADVQKVTVGGILKNKVSMAFDIKQAEPGDNVTLRIASDPQSMVHLLAVDSSSLIMSKGNQITEERTVLHLQTVDIEMYNNANVVYELLQVLEDMKLYSPEVKDKLFFYQRDCYGTMTEIKHDKLYSAYRFEEAGTIVMTDAALYDEAHYKYHPYYDLRNLWNQIEKNCDYCCTGRTTTTTTTTTTPLFHITSPYLLTPYAGGTYPPPIFSTLAPGMTYSPLLYPTTPAPAFSRPYTDVFGNPLPTPGGVFPNSGSGSLFRPHTDGNGNLRITYRFIIAVFGNPLPTAAFTYPMFMTTTAAFLNFRPTQATVTPTGSVAKVQRIRQNFPETWLWQSELIGMNGTASITSEVPDSITSWVAKAFSINKKSGLGVSETDATINVFRPFFININLPFSVIHGEEVVLQVNVFNYMTSDQSVIVTLEKNVDFKNIIENGDGTTSLNSVTVTETIQVQAGSSGSVYFPIVPGVIGKIDLSVKAQTTLAADAVKRQLRVEPEGVAKEYNVPIVVDMSNTTEGHYTVPVEFPPSLVKGSERVNIYAIGDFMGPSVKGLDKLLTLPTGCGEQTMIGFAPDAFAYTYLKSSNQLTPDVADKALEFMDRGYQRELKFQHSDGSFSVWGQEDPEGSTWLTAFVLKSFHQAKDYVEISQEVLQKAQDWLIAHQDRYSGVFSEERNVRHRSLQGGVDKAVSLTAYVTIALVESKDISKFSFKTETAIQKATQYLERQIQYLNDPYDIAISSYALALTGSQKAADGIQKLEAQASKQGAALTTTPKPDCQDPPADIVFVLDSSGSIGPSDFQKILTFVQNMVRRLNLEHHHTRVSVITFSSSTYQAFGLDAFDTKSDILDAITRVPYYGGGTATADALRFVRQNSFQSNRNATKIVIVITDGNSNDRSATLYEATKLKETGVIAFSVGIGYGISNSELQNIASGNDHVFLASDYQALQRVQISLGKENCHAPVRIPWKSSGKSMSYFWSSPNIRADPVDIETSAYVMLYYTKTKEFIKGNTILKWILKQRNANGGFSSTQDTILALQAMSEMVQFVHGGTANPGNGQNLNIRINAGIESQTFNLNTNNRMVLQNFQPTNVPRVVNITSTGQGVGLVQVAVDYHIHEQIEQPVFAVNVTIVSESLENIVTKICTRYNGSEGATGMSIIEHGVLSGFEVDVEDVSANVEIKKTEVDDITVYIYLDEITTSDTCVTVISSRTTMVAKVKQAPVRVYDYYKPEHQVTTFYLPKVLQDSSYCDVCAGCKCNKKSHGHGHHP